MTVQRSENFDTDVVRQFRWYLLETELDPSSGSSSSIELKTKLFSLFDCLKATAGWLEDSRSTSAPL